MKDTDSGLLMNCETIVLKALLSVDNNAFIFFDFQFSSSISSEELETGSTGSIIYFLITGYAA